jgi:isoquinoline 1-oxidoreductase alpha subunit
MISVASMSSMTINGEALNFRLSEETPLLWALRDAANLTGTNHGCDHGDCGACTVIVDGQATKSCLVTIASLEGADVVTIEGLSSGRSHPFKQAWLAEQVGQCGYCEPGIIMAVVALLRTSPNPSEQELESIGNICRCGIGPRLKKAIARTARASGGTRGVAPSNPEAD